MWYVWWAKFSAIGQDRLYWFDTKLCKKNYCVDNHKNRSQSRRKRFGFEAQSMVSVFYFLSFAGLVFSTNLMDYPTFFFDSCVKGDSWEQFKLKVENYHNLSSMTRPFKSRHLLLSNNNDQKPKQPSRELYGNQSSVSWGTDVFHKQCKAFQVLMYSVPISFYLFFLFIFIYFYFYLFLFLFLFAGKRKEHLNANNMYRDGIGNEPTLTTCSPPQKIPEFVPIQVWRLQE